MLRSRWQSCLFALLRNHSLPGRFMGKHVCCAWFNALHSTLKSSTITRIMLLWGFAVFALILIGLQWLAIFQTGVVDSCLQSSLYLYGLHEYKSPTRVALCAGFVHACRNLSFAFELTNIMHHTRLSFFGESPSCGETKQALHITGYYAIKAVFLRFFIRYVQTY